MLSKLYLVQNIHQSLEHMFCLASIWAIPHIIQKYQLVVASRTGQWGTCWTLLGLLQQAQMVAK